MTFVTSYDATFGLEDMYKIYILIHMKTTMILDDALLKRALELTGLKEKTAAVHAGLEALIARESARRLAKLGGTMPDLALAPRRRPTAANGRNRRGSDR